MAVIFTANRPIKASSGYYKISTPAGPNHLLNASGDWTHPSAVIGASSDTQVLVNVGGVMTGDSNFTYVTAGPFALLNASALTLDCPSGTTLVGDTASASGMCYVQIDNANQTITLNTPHIQLVCDEPTQTVTLNKDLIWPNGAGPVVTDSMGAKFRLGCTVGGGAVTLTAV